MSLQGVTVDQKELERVVRQIVERYRPTKVILFGSHAYGEPTEDSDVDLLVVMDTNENRLRAAANISAGIDHPFPLDIVVFKPGQLEASIKRGGVFATEVAKRGIVLHET